MKTDSISLSDLYEQLGDEHILTTIETPMRDDAFLKTDVEKIEEIAIHFEKKQIEEKYGLDLLCEFILDKVNRLNLKFEEKKQKLF